MFDPYNVSHSIFHGLSYDQLSFFLEEITELREKEREMATSFLNERIAPVASALAEVESTRSKIVSDIEKRNLIDGSTWWSNALELMKNDGDGGAEFIGQVKRHLEDRLNQFAIRNTSSVIDRFSNVYGLRLTIATELDKLMNARETALKAVLATCKAGIYPERDVNQTLSCRKCKRRDTDITCEFCKTDVPFLFSFHFSPYALLNS